MTLIGKKQGNIELSLFYLAGAYFQYKKVGSIKTMCEFWVVIVSLSPWHL